MKRETFSRAADRASQALAAVAEPMERERPSHMCAANGCPMWGSISDTTVGEVRQRWCRFHFGEGGRHVPAITTALRQNRALVDAVQRARARCSSDEAGPESRFAMIEAENALAVAMKAARQAAA